jgi:broad specificity phosphatase PhoE
MAEPKLVSLFIRHGETAGNAGGLFRGNIDFPLDHKGFKAADTLNPILRKLSIGSVYRSDTTRTEQTAEHALKGTGLEASPTKDLNSWNVGFLSGTKKSENQFQIDQFTKNPDLQIPGGESLNEFRHRVQPRIKTIIGKGISSGVPSLAFTHSSVVHELSHMVYGDPSYKKVKPGGIVGVYHDGEKLSLRELHLPGGEEDNRQGS